jgi:hypothetical protein
MVGAFAGASGTHLLPKKMLMLLFAAVMFIVGCLMLRRRAQISDCECSTPRCLLSGFAVGVLTGFLGVGGGFLIVPALIFAGGLEMRRAAGTSLVVIALNSAAGLAGQLRYARIPWELLAGFLVFAFAGMAAGILLARKMNERMLRRVFAVVLLSLALFIGSTNV